MLKEELHIYVNDAWSRNAAEEVVTILLQAHGMRIKDIKPGVHEVLGLKSEVSGRGERPCG